MRKQTYSITKKLTLFVVTNVIAVSSFMGINQVLANNYTDTSFGYSFNGDGSDIGTSMRAKQDSSASYVFNNATNSATITVAVAGSKTYSSVSPALGPNDYKSSYYVVKTGNRKYITNSMYPTCKYAFLVLSTYDGRAHYISGKWSPDNCSGY